MPMIPILFLALGLFQTSAGASPAPIQNETPSPAAAPTVETSKSAALAKIKRIYVDSFGDDAVSKQLQSMVIDSLTKSPRFIVTESKERADVILKGVGTEKTHQELHSTSEGTSVGTAGGGEHGEVHASNGSLSGSHDGGFFARKLGISDAQSSTETIDNVRLAVRLVSPDGDVVWSSVKESHGAKYKGAAADAADQVIKQLQTDVERVLSGGK